jgi:hypothetical protein
MSFDFDKVVDKAIKNKDYSSAIEYLEKNSIECLKDNKVLERLLNRAATNNLYEEIEQILTILRKKSFLFDSIDYTHGLRQLIKDG